MLNVIETHLPGVLIFEPRVHRDGRGYFYELWRHDAYVTAGVPGMFVQDNVSWSGNGVLRGLHYQHPRAQGKLISVLHGAVFDVAVDIRIGSPTYRQWVGAVLSDENQRQIYIPEGFAHGFVVTADSALVSYKCTSYYDPAGEGSVLWNDPDLGVEWPVKEPVLSPKDRSAPRLSEIVAERMPRFQPERDGSEA